MKKIVICGGHLTPALALIEELQSANYHTVSFPRPSDIERRQVEKSIRIYFIGRKYTTEGSSSISSEYKVAEEKKIKFYSLIMGRLQRKFTRYTVLSILKIPIGLVQSFYYLLAIRPNLIVSFGGYVSPPIVFAGWLLGIDSVIHEQTSSPGLANKFNSLFAKKIFLTWPQTMKYFDNAKAEVIGNPTRKAIFNKIPNSKDLKDFIKKSKKYILVTGGNQGSHFINRLIFKSLPYLRNYQIIHQLGTINFKDDHKEAYKLKKSNYLAIPFISPNDVGSVISNSSLVIARSGANTVWELAVLAKPAVLIPLTVSSGNEQLENAKILEKAGCAIVLKQESLKAEIFIKSIQKVFENLPKYQKSAQSFKKSLPENAANRMEKYIFSLLNSHNL